MTDFAAVDTGAARELVAMMDATDAWPAVRAARAWVLRQAALDRDSVVVDAGCGPGTFGGSVSGAALDLDRSEVMLRETRRRAAAALAWVPHARLARELPSTMTDLVGHFLVTRRDTVTLTAWDPDDPGQHDGPPGLPLHSIAGARATDLIPVAARAREGHFRAEVALVTCLARRGHA